MSVFAQAKKWHSNSDKGSNFSQNFVGLFLYLSIKSPIFDQYDCGNISSPAISNTTYFIDPVDRLHFHRTKTDFE